MVVRIDTTKKWTSQNIGMGLCGISNGGGIGQNPSNLLIGGYQSESNGNIHCYKWGQWFHSSVDSPNVPATCIFYQFESSKDWWIVSGQPNKIFYSTTGEGDWTNDVIQTGSGTWSGGGYVSKFIAYTSPQHLYKQIIVGVGDSGWVVMSTGDSSNLVGSWYAQRVGSSSINWRDALISDTRIIVVGYNVNGSVGVMGISTLNTSTNAWSDFSVYTLSSMGDITGICFYQNNIYICGSVYGGSVGTSGVVKMIDSTNPEREDYQVITLSNVPKLWDIHNTGSRLLVCGKYGFVAWTVDNQTWAQKTVSNTDYFHIISTQNTNTNAYELYGHSTTDAVKTYSDNKDWDLKNIPYLLTAKSGNIEKKYVLARKNITLTTITKPSTTQWNKVAYDGGKYVMIGNSYYYTTSPDLSTWSTPVQRTSAGVMSDILYAQGKFVVCGNSGAVGYSYDGENWTFTTFSNVPWKYLCFNNNVWTMRGNTRIAYSNDGITWNNVIPSYAPTNIVYGNNKFVGITSGKIIVYSANVDTSAWTVGYQGSTINQLSNVVYGNNKFVAGGSVDPSGRGTTIYPCTLISTDGVNWTLYTQNILGDKIVNLQFYDGKFVADYYSTVNKVSTDGINWTDDSSAVVPSYICGTKLFTSTSNDGVYAMADTAPILYM